MVRILWSLPVVMATFFILTEVYVKLVAPMFNWGGMTLNPRDDRIFEYSLIALTTLFLPSKIRSPSDFYYWLHFILLHIPSSVLSAEQGSDRYYLFLMFAAIWLLMLFKVLFAQATCKRSILASVDSKQFPYHSVFLFVSIILVFLAISVGGFINFNFRQVYEFRFAISENMPLALRYLVPLASGTLTGYLCALSLNRRNITGLVFIMLLSVLFFGYSSHKSMLFNPIVAIAGYYLFQIGRPHLLILAGFSSFAIMVLLLPGDFFQLSVSLFANRVVFLPNHINFFYFNFFSIHPFMLWAESKISLGLIDSKLPMDAVKYIGGLMTGSYEMTANTGWIANAYMNGGLIAIIFYAIAIAAIFSLIDFWAKIYGKQFVGAAFLIPVVTLIMSADLLVVLLTSGLITLLILFQVVTWPGLQVRKNKVNRNVKNLNKLKYDSFAS